MEYSTRCIILTDSFSAESRGWGDNVWLPGPLPWRLQQTWGGGDVRCSRLCKVIHNEKKKRQTILNIDNVQKITNSETLRLLGPGQDYSKLLGSMGGQGLYHPFMQVGKFIENGNSRSHIFLYGYLVHPLCMAIFDLKN